jgi:hypothetical protein
VGFSPFTPPRAPLRFDPKTGVVCAPKMYWAAAAQSTPAPPQHRLYFLPESQGHASFATL